MIYLNHAATTPPLKEALGAYITASHEFYNPGTIEGRRAKELLENARKDICEVFHCDDLIFTSGGTESNNMAIFGVESHLKRVGKTHIITTAYEHKSVKKPLSVLNKRGFAVTYLSPLKAEDITGGVRWQSKFVEAFKEAITPKTGLASIQLTNSEKGFTLPINDIYKVCVEHGILLHVDAVQGFHELKKEEIWFDMASVSAHKFGGVRGAGALLLGDRRCKCLSPFIYGGDDQEYGLRGGTQNVAGAVAMAKAAQGIDDGDFKLGWARSDMINIIGQDYLDPVCRFDANRKNNSTFSLTFRDIQGEALVIACNLDGLCISAGSACNTKSSVPSDTLKALGYSDDQALRTVRISLGPRTTKEEVIEAAHIIKRNVHLLTNIQSQMPKE